MKTLTMFIGALALLALAQPAFAQEGFPRIETFGGVSYLPANGDDFPRDNSAGFQASVSGNLNRWFSIVGDFGGHYSSEASVYQYLAGPRFTKRTERVSAFGHFLTGGATGLQNGCVSCGFSGSGFTLAGGGGLDVNVNRRIAIRAIQLDYMGSFADMLETNLRAGFGIVFKLGGS